MKKAPILLLSGLFFSMYFLAACSGGQLGYGVILWSDSELANGQLVTITRESKVKQSYQFAYQNQSYELSISRVAFFRHMPQAEAYRKKILQYRNWYAENKNPSGLVLRSKPSPSAEQIYRLRPKQTVKILDRASEVVTLGELEGIWYEVLTDDGVHAYAFDYYLHIEDRGQTVIKMAANEQQDTAFSVDLDSLRAYWYLKNRVEHMRQSTEGKDVKGAERIDIRLLQLQHGQLYVQDNQLQLYFEKPYSTAFILRYDEVDKKIPSELNFLSASGSDTRISFETIDRISIYYRNANNQESIAELERISAEEREQYRQKARAQRREDLSYILGRGSQFSAPKLYGSIQFRSNGHFNWSNTQALVEQDMLREPQTEGTIYFLYQLKNLALQSYDKVITFAFTNGEELSFLLRIDDEKVAMRYLPAYITKHSSVIKSDAIADKIDLEMELQGRALELD